MSDVYSYQPDQIAAMLQAYREAPDEATIGELREQMDAAAAAVQVAQKTSWTRQELVDICCRAVVPEDNWRNRDSAAAQSQLGTAMVLLMAGCDFSVRQESQTLWVRISYRGFSWFEGGYDGRDDSYLSSDEFYLPTPERLDRVSGGDWY